MRIGRKCVKCDGKYVYRRSGSQLLWRNIHEKKEIQSHNYFYQEPRICESKLKLLVYCFFIDVMMTPPYFLASIQQNRVLCLHRWTPCFHTSNQMASF